MDKKVKEERLKALTSFTNAYKDIIASNDNAYRNSFKNWGYRWTNRLKDYSEEEIEKIIDSGSIIDKIKLSRNYFYQNGFYRRILLHYATLLKYVGLVIPNPSFGKSLSESYIQKKYYNAVDFVDSVGLPSLFERIAIRALRDGCYYGVIQSIDKKSLVVLDLPTFYCASNFKDKDNNDIIEFDVRYFDSIADPEVKKGALSVYPKAITNWYRRFKNGKVSSPWVRVPTSIGICMPFLEGIPSFLNIIPAAIKYDKAVDTNQERDLEEIRKIIVQKIPHLSDGGLLFEPDEAAVIHKGTVRMMQNNPNVSVLTTYADVDAIVSKAQNDNTVSSLQAALANIYSESGTTSHLFGTDSNLALETSLNNDTALMMTFAHKLDNFITNILNKNYANSNISFKYTILPITYYNTNKYVDSAFKLATSGYSFLMPAMAMGLSQKELGNLKDLENDVLELGEKLIPLSTSFTESSTGTGQVGRPEKDLEDKSEKTVANQEAIDRGGSTTNDSE